MGANEIRSQTQGLPREANGLLVVSANELAIGGYAVINRGKGVAGDKRNA